MKEQVKCCREPFTNECYFLFEKLFCCFLVVDFYTYNVGTTPVRLDIYNICPFLEGGVEGTLGFGLGSVSTIPRERPSSMVERRECVCEARAAHSLGQWFVVTGQRRCWRQLVQEYVWPQSYNKIRISTTSANGGTYAGPYPCHGWVQNLEPTSPPNVWTRNTVKPSTAFEHLREVTSFRLSTIQRHCTTVVDV